MLLTLFLDPLSTYTETVHSKEGQSFEGQDAWVDEMRVWLENGGGKGRRGFFVVKVSQVRPIPWLQ